MEVRLLGSLEVVVEGAPVEIEAPKERAVLEVLALRSGEVVPSAALIDALWGEDPPPSAPKSLHSHVSRLRQALPEGTIATVGAGYRLCLDPDDVDAIRLARLAGAARQAAAGDDPGRALLLAEEAQRLWRGAPLGDLADGELRRGQTVRLEELRATTGELRVDARLALGDHEQVVAELEALVAEEPLRERRWAQLMLALYRSQRRADALAAYQRIRRLLADELGIEPSTELQELEGAILRDDPDLAPPAPSPPRTLPTPLTSFVGREELVREMRKRLHLHRLVALIGPGGVGKSRLALEVADQELDEWSDGIWWLDLSRVEPRSGLVPHLVRALRVVVPPGSTPQEALRWALGPQRVLLVVDNAEAMAGSLGAQLAEVLTAGPGVTALVTSRVPVAVPGQHEILVPPLDLPAPGADDVLGVESVRLFLDRLADHDVPVPDAEGLAAVAELCRLVDGLPLGIELVAARVGRESPALVLEELRDRAELLAQGGSGHDPRQASLRAVLDSSLALLGPEAVRCLGRLAQTPGDVDAATARAVVGAELTPALGRLVASGIATRVESGPEGARVRLLETVLAYGRAIADPEEADEAARRHAECLRDLAREAGAHMEEPDEAAWLERLRQEDGGLRAALGWWQRHDPPGALAFANALGRAWYAWSDLDGAVRLLEPMLADAPGQDDEDRAWAHLRLAWPKLFRGDPAGAEQAMDEAASRFARLGRAKGLATTLAARAHLVLLASGDVDAGLAGYREALDVSRRAGLATVTAWNLVQAAQAIVMADRVDDEVDAMLAEAETTFAATDDLVGLAHVQLDRMFAAYARDDLDGADRAITAGIAHSRSAANPGYEHILVVARGAIRVHQGKLAEAADVLLPALTWARRNHQLFVVGIGLQAAAVLVARAGDATRAARLWGAAGLLVPVWPLFARRYGALLHTAREELGDAFDAEAEIGAALPLADALGLVPTTVDLPA